MKSNRFTEINESKFERLSQKELQKAKGGLCLLCKKRERKYSKVRNDQELSIGRVKTVATIR